MMYKQDIERVAEMISKEYGVNVPKYDLTRVFELLSSFNPSQINNAVTEFLMLGYKHISAEKRAALPSYQDMFAVLEAFHIVFRDIYFDTARFNEDLDRQVENNEALLIREDLYD